MTAKPKSADGAPKAIELIPKDLLLELDNGEYVAAVGAHPDLLRDTGAPSELGDVLSVQPDGTLQTRPRGTDGLFERCVVGAAGLVYRPQGIEGRTWLVPFTDIWPNG